MPRRVCILTGNSLSHNPRVVKEASALSEAGYEVEILGAWLDPTSKARDLTLLADARFSFTPVLDVTTQLFEWWCSRLQVKSARILNQTAALESRWQLGYSVCALLQAARCRIADLFIAHSEPGLWAVSQLTKQRSRRSGRTFQVGVDMEDWFSEDLLPEARKRRPIQMLIGLEKDALCSSVHSTCTSVAMSTALTNHYGCEPPKVIYNAFPWSDREELDGQFIDRENLKVPTIHWYSQTLGPGRGLEELVAALPHVQGPVEVHLRGQSAEGFGDWLRSKLPEDWQSRVFIHGLVSNSELLSRIAEHDIGFAGELDYCRSRNLTVTNKILHYLLAGLAVVASDTAGQREIARQAGDAVRLYRSNDPRALARELNTLLTSPTELKSAKSAALAAAEQTFCWERQVPKLLHSVENALTQ